MDLQQLMPWLTAAALILGLGNTVTQFFTSGAKKTASDLEAFKAGQQQKLSALWDKLDEHDSRIQAVEIGFNHLPDKDAVHRLELALSEMKVEIVKIGASADQSARTAARVETYLLENK